MKKKSIDKPIKILTDIRINQSDIWGKATKHVSQYYKWDVLVRLENSLSPASRLMSFFNFLIFIFNIRNFDVFVNANIYTAQLIALYRKLFRIVKPAQIILELMLDEESASTKWKMKKKLQRYIFSCVDIIFVSSIEETFTYSKRLSIPRNKIQFLPFHTNVIEPKIIEKHESFILSAGRTGRDYKTLIEAVRELPVEVKIISDYDSIRGLTFPKNVQVMVEVPYKEYIEHIKNCRFVIVPLKELVKSTGQVVLLDAMSYGKPLIATEVVGTRNYINDRENGLLVPPQNIERLKNAILTLINDKKLSRMLAKKGYQKIKEDHSLQRYLCEIIKVAESFN